MSQRFSQRMIREAADNILSTNFQKEKEQQSVLHTLSVSRTTTGRATSAVELNNPGARTRGRRTSKHAKWGEKGRKAATRVTRFSRERHPFPGRSAPTSTRAPRRLRSCGSPARTSPPARGRASGQWANRRGRAAERDKCHYLKKKTR